MRGTIICAVLVILFFEMLLIGNGAAKRQSMKQQLPGEQNSKRRDTPLKGHNDTCTSCKLIISILQTTLRGGHADPKQFENLVWDICETIEQADNDQECKVILTFLDRVIEWLVHDKKDPIEICKQLELCTEYNLRHPDFKRVQRLQGRIMESARFSDMMKTDLKKHHGFVTPHGSLNGDA